MSENHITVGEDVFVVPPHCKECNKEIKKGDRLELVATGKSDFGSMILEFVHTDCEADQ